MKRKTPSSIHTGNSSTTPKRVAVVRPQLPCISSQDKEEVLSCLRYLLKQLDANTRKSCIRIGTNAVMREMENDGCDCLLVCRDYPVVLYSPVVAAAKIKQIPHAVLPRAASQLAELTGIRRTGIIGILKVKDNAELQNVSAACDKLRECIIEKVAVLAPQG